MGDSLNEDLGSGLTAEKVAVGFGTVCAILDDGDSETGHSLKCWGKGDSGGLGLGDAVTRGDNQYEMGNYLPAVNLGLSLALSTYQWGELRMLHSQQQHGSKCRSGIDGRTGLGKSGATGTNPERWGMTWISSSSSFQSPRWTNPATCLQRGRPSSETLDSASSYVGNKTDSK